jgi:hypothetical protein
VAYVYVQTTKGVDVYDATAAGKLTLVKGSPFATVGQMEGINGKYLLSVGTTNINVYAIESNGAMANQTANVDTQNYAGGECGTTSAYAGMPGSANGALLDHSESISTFNSGMATPNSVQHGRLTRLNRMGN